MKRFIYHFHSRSLAAIANRQAHQTPPLAAWKFIFAGSGVSVGIGDLLVTQESLNLHKGLRLFVEVQAPSEDEAQAAAKAHSELVLNSIAFTTRVSSPAAKLQGSIELGDQSPYPFTSTAYPADNDNESVSTLRQIDEETFKAVFNAYTASPQDRGRILRALSWLRKGLNENDQTDEFVSYWIGIEILSCLLRDRLKMKARNPSQWAGIEDVFTRKLSLSNFQDMKLARDELLHGLKELSATFIADVRSYRVPA
jgi:hypothetical protein